MTSETVSSKKMYDANLNGTNKKSPNKMSGLYNLQEHISILRQLLSEGCYRAIYAHLHCVTPLAHL